MAKRIAAIDIGTVTCRMLIADASFDAEHGRIEIDEKDKMYEITNLGEGVDATHMLKPEAISRAVSALEGFKAVIDSYGKTDQPVEDIVVVATSASRDASNSADFISELERIGLQISIIAGSVEASLSFVGATNAFSSKKCMVVDVGGGSTEVSFGSSGSSPVASRSFNVGCRRVTDRFLKSDIPTPGEMESARAWIKGEMGVWISSSVRELDAYLDAEHMPAAPQCEPLCMIAVAGTATTAVSIRDSMEVYDSERVNGAHVTLAELQGITGYLASLSNSEREHVIGLDPKRAPVIVGGMLILEETMKAAHVDGFIVSESGILAGMVCMAYNSAAKP